MLLEQARGINAAMSYRDQLRVAHPPVVVGRILRALGVRYLRFFKRDLPKDCAQVGTMNDTLPKQHGAKRRRALNFIRPAL